MNFRNPLVLAPVVLFVLVVMVGFAARFFAPEARLERRRRRNNYRVVSKAKRRTVSLSVRTKK